MVAHAEHLFGGPSCSPVALRAAAAATTAAAAILEAKAAAIEATDDDEERAATEAARLTPGVADTPGARCAILRTIRSTGLVD